MNARTFRRIALGLEGAIEGAHMGHADFRAHGRIFASLDAEEKVGMVALTPAQQNQFVEEHPNVFFPAPGAWGRQGYTRVTLAAADEETVGEAMTLAWRNSAEKRKARRAKPKTKR
jgi:hypothetical protein